MVCPESMRQRRSCSYSAAFESSRTGYKAALLLFIFELLSGSLRGRRFRWRDGGHPSAIYFPTTTSPLTVVRLHQALLAVAVTLCCACHSDPGAYDAFNRADCLPAITLVDQSGHQVQLSSLKGKPVVVDFIYTSCPGSCLLLTQKMAHVAARLAPRIGSDFSDGIDHRRSRTRWTAQLAGYVRAQEIDSKGWLVPNWCAGQRRSGVGRFSIAPSA